MPGNYQIVGPKSRCFSYPNNTVSKQSFFTLNVPFRTWAACQ